MAAHLLQDSALPAIVWGKRFLSLSVGQTGVNKAGAGVKSWGGSGCRSAA